MSYELTDGQQSKGQFASNGGYSDLIRYVQAHASAYPGMLALLQVGESSQVAKIRREALQPTQKAPLGVASTMTVLGQLLQGMKQVVISDGVTSRDIAAYSEDEPRDDHGRWTTGSGTPEPPHVSNAKAAVLIKYGYTKAESKTSKTGTVREETWTKSGAPDVTIGGGVGKSNSDSESAFNVIHAPNRTWGGHTAEGLEGALNEKDPLGQLNKLADGHHNTVEKAANFIAGRMGFDPVHLVISDAEPYKFTLNGQPHEAAGTYSPESGNIILYTRHVQDAMDAQAIMTHEVMHSIFAQVETARQTEYTELMADPRTAWHPGSNGMKADGSLSPELAKEYPIYQQFYKYFYSSKGGMDALSKADGVSDYSKQYWTGWNEGKVQSNHAITETLSEVARVRYYHNEELGWAGDNADRQQNANDHYNEIVKPIWRGLFTTYMNVYKSLPQNRGKKIEADSPATMQVNGKPALVASYNSRLTKVVFDDGSIAFVVKKTLNAKAHKLEAKTVFQGLQISIENKVGSTRSGVKPDGTPWSVVMPFDYGYIRGTVGQDGQHVDCFIGPDKAALFAYVIHQTKQASDEYDEDKVMLGFSSPNAAKKAYASAFDDKVGLMQSMTTLPMRIFIEKVLKTKELKRSKKIHAGGGDMNLEAQIDLQAGGPGSGRHPEGGLSEESREKVEEWLKSQGYQMSPNQGGFNNAHLWTKKTTSEHGGEVMDNISEGQVNHAITVTPDGAWSHTVDGGHLGHGLHSLRRIAANNSPTKTRAGLRIVKPGTVIRTVPRVTGSGKGLAMLKLHMRRIQQVKE